MGLWLCHLVLEGWGNWAVGAAEEEELAIMGEVDWEGEVEEDKEDTVVVKTELEEEEGHSASAAF